MAEAAEQGRLWWDKRLPANERGRVEWDKDTLTPTYMRINPAHWKLVNSDYEKARTMAHEGLHWWHGRPAVIEGKVLTEEESEAWVRKKIADCYKPEENEEEEDPDDPGGGETVEPVCEEKLVAVYYTVYESELGTGQTCFSSDDVDGFTWCHGVRANLLVPKTKVKWETQTVCSS